MPARIPAHPTKIFTATLVALAAAPQAAFSQCGVLLADEFDDGVVSATQWQVSLPTPTSAVYESSGEVFLQNRGALISAGDYDASALGGLHVYGEWTLLSTGDVLQVCTRSDGTLGGPFSDVANGVHYGFWTADNPHHLYATGTGTVSVASTQSQGQVVATIGATYRFDLLEESDSATFSVTQVDLQSNSATLTVTSIAGSPQGHHIVFLNREPTSGDHLASMGSVRVAQSSFTSGTPYCTAGVTVHGCVPSMGSAGIASALATSGFDIVVSSVPGNRYGTIFYGFYQLVTPWAPGSLSYKCIASPTQRMGVLDSGGTAGQCNGELRLDFNAWLQANPGGLGSPFVAGQVFYAQGWFRDPGAPKQTNLSDGLRFVLCD